MKNTGPRDYSITNSCRKFQETLNFCVYESSRLAVSENYTDKKENFPHI